MHDILIKSVNAVMLFLITAAIDSYSLSKTKGIEGRANDNHLKNSNSNSEFFFSYSKNILAKANAITVVLCAHLATMYNSL